MPVDPFLEPLLPTIAPLPEEIDYPALRAQADAAAEFLAAQVAEPGPDVKERRAVSLPVGGGAIDLFIYYPFEQGPHPAHIYLHGGGWSVGSIRQAAIDITCRERCIGATCVVVAVDYRKAPEHKFPAGLNDCYAALNWLAEHAEELGVRPDLITVSGGSAGANLAAALTLKVRDEGGPRLAFQVLEVPAVDLTGGNLRQEAASGYGLSLRDAQICIRDYLNSPDDARNPYASPLLAPDLSGLPPALILTAEYDVLRDQGEAYARRLEEAGVPVSYSMYEGHIHGSSAFTKGMESARAWRLEVITALRRAHEPGEAVPAVLL